jgi:hypothetical protein
MLDHGDGTKEKLEIVEPTRQSIEICANACKLFAQMACDNTHRAKIADDGIPLVLYAMKFCKDEAVVQMNACRALYNFVYRCEKAHTITVEEDALDLVEVLPDTFSSDSELILIAERTMRALAPEGWRGGADEPSLAKDSRLV